VRSATVYVLLGAAAGLASPPVGPSMRALWALLTPEPAARRRAYSLDGASEEVLFTAGPLLVAALTAVDGRTGPIAALALTAVLNMAGGVGLAVAASASPPDRPRLEASVSLLGPLRAPGFGLLVAVVLGVGIGGGPIEVAVLARAQASGDPQAVGVLVAVLSAGSVLGGLWWGRRAHRRSTAIHLICLTVLLAAGSLAAAAAPTLPVLGLALFIAGLASAPTLVVAYLAADDLAPPGGRTEATSWVSTANNVGVALGAGGAGVLVDRGGPGSAFLAGAAVLAITAGLLSVIGRRLQPVIPPEHEPAR
jgi:hypothetical protein